MSDEFISPKKILGKILKGLIRDTPQYRAGMEMMDGWEAVAGKILAEKSRVSDLKNDCLHIAVRDMGVMQLILMKKYDILNNLRKRYPRLNIKDIRVFKDNKLRFDEFSQKKEGKKISFEEEQRKNKEDDKEFQALMQRIKNYGKSKNDEE